MAGDGQDAVDASQEKEEDDALTVNSRGMQHILTLAGKVVWSSSGRDGMGRLATVAGICTAVLGVARQNGEGIRSIMCGDRRIVLLQRGELVLVNVGVDAEAYLLRELEFAYEAIVMSLTNRVHKVLKSSPGYDVAELLGSTVRVLDAMYQYSGSRGEWFGGGPRCVRLEPAAREEVGRVLSHTRKIAKHANADLVFAFVLCRDAIVHILAPSYTERCLKATDVLLAATYVSAQRAALSAAESSWLPICLPRFEPSGYLHAAVSYLDPAIELSLVLVAADNTANTITAFRSVAQAVSEAFRRDGSLQALRTALTAPCSTAQATHQLKIDHGACKGSQNSLIEHFLFIRRRPLSTTAAHSKTAGLALAKAALGTRIDSASTIDDDFKEIDASDETSPANGSPTGKLRRSTSFRSSNRTFGRALSSGRDKFFGTSTDDVLSSSSDVFPPAAHENAITQCLASDAPILCGASNEPHTQHAPELSWHAYRDLALRLRCNSTQAHFTLPPTAEPTHTAHDIFETPLPSAALYETHDTTTYFAISGHNFELYITFSSFKPAAALLEHANSLLQALNREESYFFFDPIFY